MLKRLFVFVKVLMYALFFASLVTLVVPVAYWAFTGRDYMLLMDRIENF